jgi:hypothetical protein
MPFDLTELLENATAPRMHVDPGNVLARGRRRRLRRRIYGTAAALGAAAVLVPAATAIRLDTPPTPAPAASLPADCLLAGPNPHAWQTDPERDAHMTGTPWLDTGSMAGNLDARVQVSTDTCHGLAVAVAMGPAGHGSGFIVTDDISGRPDEAFWVAVATGGGTDRFGKVLPVTSTAVVLLPTGQQVCDIGAGPEAGAPEGQSPSLSKPVTVPAGAGWQASFATMSTMGNPQGATLQICEGSRVVAPALRPLNAIDELLPTPTGSAVTYSTTEPDGSTTVRDGNGTVTKTAP